MPVDDPADFSSRSTGARGPIDFQLGLTGPEQWLGREDVFRELDRLLPREGAARAWVLVRGGPGLGKTALMARYVQRLQASGEAVPHHFLKHDRGDWARPWRVVNNLVAWVEQLFGVTARAELSPVERLSEVLQRVSDEHLVPERKRLVLVVDALDEVEESTEEERSPQKKKPGQRDNPLPGMLPHVLPPGVQVLCSSRPTYPMLSWLLQKPGIQVLDLDDARWAESNREVVRLYWEGSSLGLAPELIAEAVRRSEGNILYTVKLAEWLEGQPPEHRRAEVLPRGLDEFLTMQWTRMWTVEGEERAEIETGLSLLMAAREALPRSRLMELAGWAQAEKAERFLRIARPFLLEEPGSRAWRPFHLSFRTFVVNQLSRQVMRAAHRRLAEHLGRWPAQEPGDDFGRVYAARHAVEHWLEAGAPPEALTLCQDLSYLEALCQESGVRAVEDRLEEVARRVEPSEAGSLRELGGALQAESHWLAWEPEALSRLVYNRLLSRGWTRARLGEGFRFAGGLLPALRLRHPVQLEPGGEELGGHLGGVRGCAVTEDGRRVVSASEDGTLKVWDVVARQPVATLRGHGGEVLDCAVTANGRRVVSASRDGTLKVWDAEEGQCVATLTGHKGPVRGCAVAEGGQRALSASADGTLKVWELETRRCVGTLQGHTGWVTGCALTGDGRRAVSSSRDGTLRVWDVESQRCLAILGGGEAEATACAVSHDGRRALCSYKDGVLKVWDLEAGQCVFTLRGHAESVTDCALTADGRRAVSVSHDGTLRLWDAETGQELASFNSHLGGGWCCTVTATGSHAVSASSEGTPKVWDLENRRLLTSLEGQARQVGACAVTGDGGRALSASWDGLLKVWDTKTGQTVAALPHESTPWVMACAVTADGRRAVSGDWDGTLRVWDVAQSRLLVTLTGHSEDVRHCALSLDGRRVFSASSDKTLKVWSVDTGECLATLEGHTDWVNGCAVIGEGQQVLSVSADKTMKLWDAGTGKCLATFEGHQASVNACAVMGEGRRVVSASEDGTLKVWDVRTRNCLSTLKGHTGGVNGCAVMNGGRRLVSVSDDGTLKVWEVEKHRCLDTVHGVTGFLCVEAAADLVCAGDRFGNLWLLDAAPAPVPVRATPAPPGGFLEIPGPPIELGIVIALKEELRVFQKLLPARTTVERDPRTGQYDYVFEHPATGARCVFTLLGDMGPEPAALATERLINRWAPRTLVMLGIAAGIHPDVKVGDVVVASQIDSYLDSARAQPGSHPGSFEFSLGGSVYRGDHELITHVRNLEFAVPDAFARWNRACQEHLAELLPEEARVELLRRQWVRPVPELLDVHLASGPVVGAAQEFTQWLRRSRDRNHKALDMESAGLMAAAFRRVEPGRTLVIRGISDYGDERKADLDARGEGALRRYAMHNATALLWTLLEAWRAPVPR
jgi:WD40 repeat protein/nucleoside phosphorylase